MRTQRTALVDSCESGSAISATPTWLVRRRPNPPAAQIFAAVDRRAPFSPALRLILRVAALTVWDRLGSTPGWGGLPRPHRRRTRTPCSESGLAWHAAAVTSAGARASARAASRLPTRSPCSAQQDAGAAAGGDHERREWGRCRQSQAAEEVGPLTCTAQAARDAIMLLPGPSAARCR